MTSQPSRLVRRALVSNANDAAGNQLFDASLSILAVIALGFSATHMGLMNTFASVSFLVLAVPIGALVDARGPGRVLVAALATRVFLVVAAFPLYICGLLSIPVMLAIVFLIGVSTLASETAQTALAPHLVEEPAGLTSFIL